MKIWDISDAWIQKELRTRVEPLGFVFSVLDITKSSNLDLWSYTPEAIMSPTFPNHEMRLCNSTGVIYWYTLPYWVTVDRNGGFK